MGDGMLKCADMHAIVANADEVLPGTLSAGISADYLTAFATLRSRYRDGHEDFAT